MNVTTETVINFRNCAYSLNGENLANMRRSALQPVAAAVGIRGEFSKNQLLTMLIAKLASMNAPNELSEGWQKEVS